MYKYLLIFFLSNAACFSSMAQNEPGMYADSSVLAADDANDDIVDQEVPDTTVFKRQVSISADTIAFLKRKKDFSYVPALDSLLKNQQAKDAEKMKNAGRSISFFERIFNAPLLKIFFWLLAAGLVFFILTKLFITQGVFRKVGAEKEVEEKEEEEKIFTQHDYSKLVQQSCRLGDYRSAVKYLFLRTLHLLADNSVIEFASDKTNYRYLQEIPPDKKKEFARLILNYEYIWYGNMSIGRSVYEKIEREFISFQQKIS